MKGQDKEEEVKSWNKGKNELKDEVKGLKKKSKKKGLKGKNKLKDGRKGLKKEWNKQQELENKKGMKSKTDNLGLGLDLDLDLDLDLGLPKRKKRKRKFIDESRKGRKKSQKEHNLIRDTKPWFEANLNSTKEK